MTTIETQATIQAVAALQSLANPIDQLAVLDAEIKRMTKQTKALKDGIANTLGEGKFRGEKYGVRVTIEQRQGAVDMEKLCKHFGISEEVLNSFRGESSAVIKVTPTL